MGEFRVGIAVGSGVWGKEIRTAHMGKLRTETENQGKLRTGTESGKFKNGKSYFVFLKLQNFQFHGT